MYTDSTDTIDDAADTLHFVRPDFAFESPTDPDGTGIYDLTPAPERRPSSPRRRRQIRDTRENILRLREALAQGWDIGPELAHEEQRFCALVAGS